MVDPNETPRLALLRLHQRWADLETRESLIDVGAAARTDDVIAFVTCHRVELYAVLPRDIAPRAWFADRFASAAALNHALIAVDGEVARHLFNVACGLDSAVRGEGQILGQLRRTYDEARRTRRLHPVLADLFQTALHLGRELRVSTPLGAVRRSVGSLAVDEAVRLLAAPRSATVLVVGAGEIGKLAARALRSRVGQLIIANRDRARAESIARQIGAQTVGLDAVDDALARADLAISAADTRGSLLTSDRIRARLARGPLPIIDMAVPRSVGEEARALPGLVYRSVDDLGAEADPALDEALVMAERRCEQAADAFVARCRAREATGTLHLLRERAEHVRRERLGRALSKLSHLDERDRRVVESLATGLTNALLHAPTVNLLREPGRARAVEELFDLASEK